MSSTTQSFGDGRLSFFMRTAEPEPIRSPGSIERSDRYRSILEQPTMDWWERHQVIQRLGSGGQGVVFLCERVGSDGFRLPVALKVFSPARYDSDDLYDDAMIRMARVAVEVAHIQQDNLIDVHNVVSSGSIRVMEMEWVDGYDLSQLLTEELYQRARSRVDDDRWAYINDVIMTTGARHPRFKPGIAIAILRDALAALAALHSGGIVHGDIKPSNMMLKRTGNAKLIDIGAAFRRDDPPPRVTCTPAFAAPEVLETGLTTPQSDLASLGYVLIEMLAGMSPFGDLTDYGELKEAKQSLVDRIDELLPEEVACNELLMSLVRGLIEPSPDQRFPSAEAADLVEQGAANFQRQLIMGDLASEYDIEIRAWLNDLN